MLPNRIQKLKNQSGQALLLVLLSVAVVLTVVLSVSSRSISDVSVGTYEEDALRAFSAAEAGVEQALLTNQDYASPQQINPDDASVTFTSDIVSNPPGSSFMYPSKINTGESATFWFAARDSNGNFACTSTTCYKGNRIRNLCWGDSARTYAANKSPAVLLSIYYDTTKNYLSGDYSNINVVRRGYDPDATRIGTNHFTLAETTTTSACSFSSKFQMSDIYFSGPLGVGVPSGCSTDSGCMIMARVKLFYNDSTIPENIGVRVHTSGGGILPAQGNRIESTGIAGDSTRKINVFQSFPEPPAIFDAAIFSETNITKS